MIEPTTLIIISCLVFMWAIYFLGRYVSQERPFNKTKETVKP